MPDKYSHGPADEGPIRTAFAAGLTDQAIDRFNAAGGALYAFCHGYPSLGRVLDAMPEDLWKDHESVLGALVFYLVKQGRAGRAKAHLEAMDLRFEKTARLDVYDLLVAIHLGDHVSEEKLRGWIGLERQLPLNDPLLEGLYYNAMLVMHVRFGRLGEARTTGQRAIACYREARHDYLEHFIHVHLADLAIAEGRLRAARRGLAAAERCLQVSGQLYANERDIIEIVRLALEYETGRLERIPERASFLRASLVSGDSWAELFVQLGRISVMSTYFLSGRTAARAELDQFHLDYARRHGGHSVALELVGILVDRLDWRLREAERSLAMLAGDAVQSAIGRVIEQELRMVLEEAEPQSAEMAGPRGAIVEALNASKQASGAQRRRHLEQALWLAVEEGQMAPFLEHREVFSGVGPRLSSGKFARGHKQLARMTSRVLKAVDQSYTIPPGLRTVAAGHRQFRVMSALQSGATNKQIARSLGITEATVKYHLTNLYRQAGVNRRGELIEFMSENETIAEY